MQLVEAIINEILHLFFLVFEIQRVFCTDSTSQSELAILQVPNSQIWLVATVLDSAVLDLLTYQWF